MPSAKSNKASANFEFKTTPYDHQLEAFNKIANMKYAALFMEQGTGKTKLTIDRSVYLYENGKIDAVVIICPNALTKTWQEEIATHCPDRVNPVVGIWDSKLTKKVTRELEAVLKADTSANLPFLIINIEAMRTERGERVLYWWLQRVRIHAACDESSKIKTPSAKQTAKAIQFGLQATARTILTGTPVSNSPADYFSQLNFLMPNPLGFNNYFSFRAKYCELETRTIEFRKPVKNKKGNVQKTRKIVEIKGPKNSDDLLKKLVPFSVFVKKNDCLDLPDKIYHKRHCSLSPQGVTLYNKVRKEILIGIQEQSRFLTIEYQLSRLLRLQQVVGGFLPDDDENIAQPIPGANPKIDLLLETIEEFPGPTLIWARFKPEHAAIQRALESIIPSAKIGQITGDIEQDQREEYRKQFQKGDIEYLICTQSCAGYGYTLTAAENEIYYSNTFSLEHREQSEDRAHRIGQTKHVNIVDLLIPGTIDDKLHEALKRKKELASLLTTVIIEEIV